MIRTSPAQRLTDFAHLFVLCEGSTLVAFLDITSYEKRLENSWQNMKKPSDIGISWDLLENIGDVMGETMGIQPTNTNHQQGWPPRMIKLQPGHCLELRQALTLRCSRNMGKWTSGAVENLGHSVKHRVFNIHTALSASQWRGNA